MNLPTELPAVPPKRLAVSLSRDALRQVRGGHRWVFDQSIRALKGADDGEGSPGQLGVVFGDRREFVAIGLYDPASPIRLRVLHQGVQRTVDDAFWRDVLDTAIERRRELIDSSSTNAYRLVHGENDALSGLVVDRYDTTLAVKIYSEAWFPHLRQVLAALVAANEAKGLAVERVVIRLSRDVARGETFGLADGDVVLGDAPDGPIEFLEHGLRFGADVVSGQKTGHFLDQRDNRALVRTLSQGRRVLDVFSCTGGFSVNAAAGGATSVLSVDQSRRALELATLNMARNTDRPAVAAVEHDVRQGDAFEVMTALVDAGEQFGLVIVDPPSFAHNERDRPGALAAYGRLAALGLALTAPRGTYVQSSCSSRISSDELRRAVLDRVALTGRPMTVQAETGHPLDHPVDFAEAAYLSTIVVRLEPRRH